jgi:hypothetical protein
MQKKTYIVNHIPIKQVWLEENIILIKDVQIWVDWKLLTRWKKKVIYNISKDQNSNFEYSKKWKGWKT